MTYLLLMNPPNRIRELRRARKMSQGELGLMVGLSAGQVSHIENGARNLTLEWMRRIAKALDVDAGALLIDGDVAERLTKDERAVIEAYRAAEPQARWYVQQTLEAIVAKRDKRDDVEAA